MLENIPKEYSESWSTTRYTGSCLRHAQKAELAGDMIKAKINYKLHNERVGWDGIELSSMVERERNYANGAIQNALDLPPHLYWAAEATAILIESNERTHLYHGTRLSRISGIADSGGLIAFKEGREPNAYEPAVFGCPHPIEAAHHAYTRGPEDTKKGDFTSSINPDDPIVILKINIAKLGLSEPKLAEINDYLESHYDALRTGIRDNVDWLRGIKIGPNVPLEAIEVLHCDGQEITSKSFSQAFGAQSTVKNKSADSIDGIVSAVELVAREFKYKSPDLSTAQSVAQISLDKFLENVAAMPKPSPQSSDPNGLAKSQATPPSALQSLRVEH